MADTIKCINTHRHAHTHILCICAPAALKARYHGFFRFAGLKVRVNKHITLQLRTNSLFLHLWCTLPITPVHSQISHTYANTIKHRNRPRWKWNTKHPYTHLHLTSFPAWGFTSPELLRNVPCNAVIGWLKGVLEAGCGRRCQEEGGEGSCLWVFLLDNPILDSSPILGPTSAQVAVTITLAWERHFYLKGLRRWINLTKEFILWNLKCQRIWVGDWVWRVGVK